MEYFTILDLEFLVDYVDTEVEQNASILRDLKRLYSEYHLLEDIAADDEKDAEGIKILLERKTSEIEYLHRELMKVVDMK